MSRVLAGFDPTRAVAHDPLVARTYRPMKKCGRKRRVPCERCEGLGVVKNGTSGEKKCPTCGGRRVNEA